LRRSPEKFVVPKGFSFSAVAAGIKVSGRPDLALVEVERYAQRCVVHEEPGSGRSRGSGAGSLQSTGGRVRAVVVNSGNANCATGRAGIQACERVCAKPETCSE
jgi:glutamate N-acetyltransferase / amino-acid N-acetyltransferase